MVERVNRLKGKAGRIRQKNKKFGCFFEINVKENLIKMWFPNIYYFYEN
jgi:hypothetical protein